MKVKNVFEVKTGWVSVGEFSLVYLVVGFLEVRGQLVQLLADDITQLLPGEVTQNAVRLIEEDAASQQALVEAVEEGQMGLTHRQRLSMRRL